MPGSALTPPGQEPWSETHLERESESELMFLAPTSDFAVTYASEQICLPFDTTKSRYVEVSVALLESHVHSIDLMNSYR